ncbi:MAG: hypothetical protein JWP57_1892 [Spirosoma sp.]|nr:hypothetical protein [Spirosoma sp.]
MEHEKALPVEPVGLKKHNAYKTWLCVFLLPILNQDSPYLAFYLSDLSTGHLGHFPNDRLYNVIE